MLSMVTLRRCVETCSVRMTEWNSATQAGMIAFKNVVGPIPTDEQLGDLVQQNVGPATGD